MDRMWLTQKDRIETITRGAMAGSIAGALLGTLETAGAVAAGEGVLRPWRMAASILLGRGAFTVSAEWAVFAGLLVHLVISVATGTIAAMLYEWSAWSRIHRLGSGSAGFAGALFGGLVWLLDFPIIAGGFFPWMWRLDQGPQLAFHLCYGAMLGFSLSLMGRYARNPPDSARQA